MSEQDPAQTIAALERALARERERTRALCEVGLLLDSTVPRDELLRRVLAVAARVTEAERATLYLITDDGRELVSHATEGGRADEPPQRIALLVGQGIAGAAARDRRTVSAPDAYGDPRFHRRFDDSTGFRTRSVLASPMLTPDGRVVGVLQVLNRRDGGMFDPDDVAMLEALAAQAAVAIEGARQIAATVGHNRALTELRARLERSIRERDLLLATEQLLARADSIDEFLAGALEGVMRECRAEGGAILLADEPGAPLAIRAARRADGAHPGAPELPAPGTPPPPDSIAVRAATDGAPVLLPAPASDGASVPAHDGPLVPAASSVLPGPPPRSLLVVSLPGEHGPIGALELRDRQEGPFTADDVDLLELVAANVSTGVELTLARRERERTGRLAAVGRTLSNVLHDIRTPMTIISGYAQLMPGVESAAERARHASAIVRQFEHIQAMIGELLAFVRGETQLLLQKVYVDTLFTETVDVLRQELSARGVQLRLEVNGRFAARLDTAKVTRLVHNLARNAADALATRGGGVFAITVDREGPQLLLTFEDNGPGIPESIRPMLFESFVTAGKPGGTGLGLAIVKRVVDEHAGALAVDTGAWGTRFTIRLPLNGPSSASQQLPALLDLSTRPPPPMEAPAVGAAVSATTTAQRDGTGAVAPGEKA